MITDITKVYTKEEINRLSDIAHEFGYRDIDLKIATKLSLTAIIGELITTLNNKTMECNELRRQVEELKSAPPLKPSKNDSTIRKATPFNMDEVNREIIDTIIGSNEYTSWN